MRKASSIVIAVTFVVVLVTAVFMMGEDHHEGPRMRGPHARFASAERPQAEQRRGEEQIFAKHLHEVAGVVFLVFGIVHVVYNHRPLLAHFGVRRRRR